MRRPGHQQLDPRGRVTDPVTTHAEGAKLSNEWTKPRSRPLDEGDVEFAWTGMRAAKDNEVSVDWELPTDWRQHYNVDECEQVAYHRTGMSADEVVAGLEELGEFDGPIFEDEDAAANSRAVMLGSAICGGVLFCVGFICGAVLV
jgi:hypothetical protein